MYLILKLNIFLLSLHHVYINGSPETNIETDKSLPETNEQQQFHTPLVLHVNGDKYEFPTTVEVNGNQPIFSYEKDSKHIKYYCPPEEADLIAYVNEYSLEDPYRRYCLFEMTPTTDKPGCLNKVRSFIAPPIVNNELIPPNRKCKPILKKEGSYLYGIQFMLCERPGKFRKMISVKQTLDVPSRRKSKLLHMFCYNVEMKKVIYHWFDFRSPELLIRTREMGDYANYEPNSQLSTNGYDSFGDLFENAEKEYNEKLLELDEQPNNEHTLHMIIPPDHMPFGIWKQTLFHYYNVKIMPKHVSLILDFIDQRLKSIAVYKTTDELTVLTAGFPFDGINVWHKIIYNYKSQQGILIVINEKSTQQKGCYRATPETALCEFKSWYGAETVQTELALCCFMNKRAQELFGTDFKVIEPLNLNKEPALIKSRNSHSNIAENYNVGLRNRGKSKLTPETSISEISIAGTSKDE